MISHRCSRNLFLALVLVLLGVQWRLGFSFPTTTTTTSSCDDAVEGTTHLTILLEHEAKKLQYEYVSTTTYDTQYFLYNLLHHLL